MAIAFKTAADLGNNGGSGNYTHAYTVDAASDFLFVGVEGDNTLDNISGVTYNGVAMTLVAKVAPGTDRWCYLFYLLNPATGANNVVVTNGGAGTYILAGAADYSGALGGLDNSTTNSAAAGVTSVTTSLTTVADNCWTVLFTCGNGGGPSLGPMPAGGVYRAVDAAFGTWGIGDSNGAITPPQSYSMTTGFAVASNSTEVVMASFSPTAAGGVTLDEDGMMFDVYTSW